MHKKIQEEIAIHLRCITGYNNTEADLELCESLFPEKYIWLSPNLVSLNWACKSINEVKEMLKIFAKKGIMLEKFVDHDTDPVWTLKGLFVKIKLKPYWSSEKEEGTTCRLIQVGVTTPKPEPVYRLICTDKEINNEGKEESI
jgi:hypothetical protein